MKEWLDVMRPFSLNRVATRKHGKEAQARMDVDDLLAFSVEESVSSSSSDEAEVISTTHLSISQSCVKASRSSSRKDLRRSSL